MAVTVVGSIVKSAAGRDKNRFFVVLALEDGGFAYIADGRLAQDGKAQKEKAHPPPSHQHGAGAGGMEKQSSAKTQSGCLYTKGMRRDASRRGGNCIV